MTKNESTEAPVAEAKPVPTNGTRPTAPRPMAFPTPPPSAYERSALRSKKFIGYFLSDIAWKALLALMVVTWQSGWIGQDVIFATIVCSTVVQLTYLFTQAWIDRSVRVAEIKAKSADQ